MKETFPTFDLGIDHLFTSEPEERKQKKEEQQRFACHDVSSGAPAARRAAKRSPITIGTGSHVCVEIETHCLISNREGLGTCL